MSGKLRVQLGGKRPRGTSLPVEGRKPGKGRIKRRKGRSNKEKGEC